MEISVSFTFDLSEEQLQLLQQISKGIRRYNDFDTNISELRGMELVEYDHMDRLYTTILGESVLDKIKENGPFV